VKTLWETFDKECDDLHNLAEKIWKIYHCDKDPVDSLHEVKIYFQAFKGLVCEIEPSVYSAKVIKDAISAPIPALFRGNVDNILSY